MTSGPVIPMVWEGLDGIKISRRLLGKSDPLESTPGTIRGDFSIDEERNIIHGSHSGETAEEEIFLWFHEDELVEWKRNNHHWINAIKYIH